MNKKILIADDDAQLRLALKHILRRDGHDVDEAGDGEAALKKLEGAAFDLVLIDLVMPRKGGLEAILDIRRRNLRLPIIAMSGGARLNDTDPLETALHCGATFAITKPFQPEELRALLRRCWAETGSRTSSP